MPIKPFHWPNAPTGNHAVVAVNHAHLGRLAALALREQLVEVGRHLHMQLALEPVNQLKEGEAATRGVEEVGL